MQHGGRTEVRDRSRGLRRAMTPPERRLWSVLRERPDGLRFRKQHPCGPYTLDFFCPLSGLVVEVDGEVHGRGDRPERDAIRDLWIEAQGFVILRVPAIELLHDLDSVVRLIVATARASPPPPPA